MEGSEAAKAPSQAPAPAPPRRAAQAGAGAATLRGLLAPLAAEAIPCCYFVALWGLNASNAFLVVTRRTFGKDSRAMAIGLGLVRVTFPAVLLLHIAFMLLLPWSVKTPRGDPPQIEFVPLSRSRLHVLVTVLVVGYVGMVMVVLAPTDSWLGRIGSVIIDILFYSVTFCFISAPNLLLELRAIYAKLKCGAARLY